MPDTTEETESQRQPISAAEIRNLIQLPPPGRDEPRWIAYPTNPEESR